MRETKDKKIEKWIDLSGLQRDACGRIQWKKSIGCELEFTYGGITGILKILKCDRYTNKAVVFIDGYTDINGKSICVDQIKTCSLGNILRKSVLETNPELAKYFVNTDDTYKYSAHSGKAVPMKCPRCGAIKIQIIEHLTDRGFSCPCCSDGVSWPNKFMCNILQQLNVYFIREVTKNHQGFEWVKNYQYDFYLEIKNQKYLIEMDGAFHFIDAFRPYEQSYRIDKNKDDLAQQHGIEVIRLNCHYKDLADRFDFVKNNILNSKLRNILNLAIVDWSMADKFAVNSYIVATADMWNSGIHDKKQIANSLKLSVDVIKKYLIISEQIGICQYNKKMDKEVWYNNLRTKNSKPVMLFKDNVTLDVFSSASELDRCSVDVCGKHLMKQHISEVCRGERVQTGGYTMKYITREEYEQLAPQFNSTIRN